MQRLLLDRTVDDDRRYPRWSLGRVGAAALAALAVTACEGADNPAALNSLNPQVVFEIHATELETLEEIEIHVQVMEGGSRMVLRQAVLEMTSAVSGATQEVVMSPDGTEYVAHVTFYEPGEHHLHLMGVPEFHHLQMEMGETEVDVARHHQVIGPYWVELETSPAPIGEGQAAHLHVYTFQLLPDGSRGAAVGGLALGVAVHDLGGVESDLAVIEESPGEFEAEYQFGGAGVYELHVSIDVAGVDEEGEFHVPVIGPGLDDGGHDDDGGGHGH